MYSCECEALGLDTNLLAQLMAQLDVLTVAVLDGVRSFLQWLQTDKFCTHFTCKSYRMYFFCMDYSELSSTENVFLLGDFFPYGLNTEKVVYSQWMALVSLRCRWVSE